MPPRGHSAQPAHCRVRRFRHWQVPGIHPSGPAQHHPPGESAIITDSKGELYADTAELFRRRGYEVKVFNLVNPEHGDSWNCMSDLGGDTLLAQVLTNVIIGNTSSGKMDHFWDNGEGTF